MPVLDIPVDFEYEGAHFTGTFYTTKGNENVWQLNLNGYSWGQLVKYSTGWKWCPNTKLWFNEDYMEKYFVSLVENYVKGAK